MKKHFYKLVSSAFICLGSVSILNAQSAATEFSFTVEQAVDYAMQNHPKVKNALLDQQMAEHKVKEIKGIGLPQINGSFDSKYFFEIPTSLIPADFFPGGTPGTYIPVKFGTPYNSSAGLDASQLLFSSDYLIGLKAIKVYRELSEKSSIRTRIETSAAVQKAYYSVLINEERAKLLNANMSRIGKLKNDTKVLFDNGFVEQVDYDRISIMHTNLEVEKQKMDRFVELSRALLKFQMGMEQSSSLVLLDKLEALKYEAPELATDKFDYTKRIEYSLFESQQKGAELQMKKDRNSYLPSAVLYSSLSTQAQRDQFDVFESKPWYPTGLVGIKISVPVFSGFQKHQRVQQSKLSLVKSQNDLDFIRQSIDLELNSARTGLLNSSSAMTAQKKNMELAENVFNTSKKKYEEGVGSNLEVLNAETSLKEAQTNYFNSLFEAVSSKIDFQKANGSLK